MNPVVWLVVAGLVLLPVIYVIVVYNRMVNLRQLIDNAWSNIDTELKRRYDLVPNLVNTVKGYAAHEKEVLDRVVQARAAALASTGSPASQAADENVLVRALRQVFAVAEGYPELKASENFKALQDELINTENRIQAARRFYNGNVKDLNNLVLQFPSNVLAGWFKVNAAEFFEIENAVERQVVPVKF